MNRLFYRSCLFAVTLLTMGTMGLAAHAQNNEKSLAIPHITVSGQGEVKVRPDKMEITIGVVTEDKSSKRVAAGNAQASQQVQDAIHKTGVADKDIQTVNYSINPVYTDSPPTVPAKPQPPRITGYRAYNQVRVIIRNIAKMSDVLDAATAAGSNTIEGIVLGLENPKMAEDEALEKAVLDARRKADRMVKAGGTTLAGILEMSDNTGYGPRPMEMARMDAAPAGAVTPIAAGELTITANVTITYSLANGNFK